MVKYLRRMGHEVTVIAGDAWPAEAGASGVVWTRDLVGHPAVRRLLGRPPLAGLGNGNGHRAPYDPRDDYRRLTHQH